MNSRFSVEESVMYAGQVASIEDMWVVWQGEEIVYVELRIIANGKRVVVNDDHIQKLWS